MAKYAIWDRQSNIYTPVGEVLTAEQWIARYGWIANPAAKPVVAGGLINGAFCGELSQMQEMYAKVCDFSACTTDEDILAVIEEYEDNPPVDDTPSTDERIAAALEYQVMASLPDETETV